jgi:Bacterial antitoxin of type II TA system, VapB
MLRCVGRITVEVNEEWLEAAREVLGTDTKVATINAALHAFAVRRQAKEILAAFDSVPMDFDGSGEAWGYHGGRDLSALEADARGAEAA